MSARKWCHVPGSRLHAGEARHALWTIAADHYRDTGAVVQLRGEQDPTYMNKDLARFRFAAPKPFDAATAARVATHAVLNQGRAKLAG